jgi:hypothetical protein
MSRELSGWFAAFIAWTAWLMFRPIARICLRTLPISVWVVGARRSSAAFSQSCQRIVRLIHSFHVNLIGWATVSMASISLRFRRTVTRM